MSFLITRRPEKLFTGSVKFSRWTALANPYIFELSRADFQVNNVAIRNAYSTTLPTVWINDTPSSIASAIFVGDNIFLSSGIYKGVYKVSAINGQYVTLDTPYIGVGTGGHLNAIDTVTNFKSFVSVYDSATGNLIDTVKPKPDSTGLLLCDVSGVVRSVVDTQMTTQQTVINRANKGISGGFTIGYGATYIFKSSVGNIPVTIGEVNNGEVYYWASGARQITGDTTLGMDGIGQNLKEYVPKNLAGSDAKFLSMFETPTYFEGFPFFLSFIYDADFKGTYIERHQQDQDINGASIGAETDETLLVSELGYVNQMKVEAPNALTDNFNAWIETGAAYTGGGYVIDGGSVIGSASPFAAQFELPNG
jgi:hypothetical protein